jgi:hypothetical protein
MKKAILAAVVLAVFLTGCAGETKIVYVNKYVPIPKALLVKCDVTPPPDEDKYVLSTPAQREDQLSKTNISLYGDIGTCNKRTDRLIEWDQNNKVTYGNPASAATAGS